MKKPSTILLLCLLLSAISFAQKSGEMLVDAETVTQGNSKSVYASKSLLQLPFFDDFSRPSTAPSSEFWQGSNVFVNSTYAINPPTIGVATFDAFDSKGKLYPNASHFPFSADTLTSRVINLNHQGDTTIYISFVFQPQGLGFQPSERDSLVLEFYNEAAGEWEGVWSAWVNFSSQTLQQIYRLQSDRIITHSTDTLERTFFRVHFPILESRYLNSGFQFRFRNYASLQQNATVPGLLSNSDHWHIDQVYLDKDRSFDDTLHYDIAFARTLGSILVGYENIPWKHFNSVARLNELPNPLKFSVLYRNLNRDDTPAGRQVTRRFNIYNHSTGENYDFSSAADNIPSLTDYELNREYIYDFQSSWADSAKFTFTSYLATEDPELFRWNDTIRYTQQFLNYYAYDDGTAEAGYGVYGEGAQNAEVALQFSFYEKDTLMGVYMYFNRAKDDANQRYFQLVVWDDNDGKPGNPIYSQMGLRPQFADSLNKFILYRLKEELPLEAGIYYVGWKQTSQEMLNVGYDRNNNNRSRLYYNVDGQWVNTHFDGSLMLRPVFKYFTEWPTHTPAISLQQNIRFYPNPASDYITIELPNLQEVGELHVYNILGQRVLLKEVTDGSQVELSTLANGTYIMRIMVKGQLIGNQKLVIRKW